MSDWVVSDIVNEETESISSLAPSQPDPVDDVTVSRSPRTENRSEEQVIINQYKNATINETLPPKSSSDEAVSQIKKSYEIKNFAVKKSDKSISSWLLGFIIISPILLIFAISSIANRNSKSNSGSFLYKTLESKYFSINVPHHYNINSVIDKKVPFIERHILTSTEDGQKEISILIKDVKFDYELNNNLLYKQREANSDLYSLEPYKLKYKEGYYFKKKSENFEHVILLADRSKSVIYEIVATNPSAFFDDTVMQSEINEMLESITFLQ